MGNPLERLNKGIDFEIFKKLLSDSFDKAAKGKGGRPPYNYILMFFPIAIGTTMTWSFAAKTIVMKRTQ